MTTALVWLLAISTNVNSGSILHITPQAFPTLADCQQLQKNLPGARTASTRCIQTRIVVKEPT